MPERIKMFYSFCSAVPLGQSRDEEPVEAAWGRVRIVIF